MRIARVLAVIAALILGVASASRAQDAPKAGVTVGYPGAIGILWHATDSVAVRPTFAFSHSSTDTSLSEGSGWGGGFDLSVLFYAKRNDTVRTYISPRVSYVHSSNTVTATTTLPPGTTATTFTSTGTSAGGAGTFGAQYTPTRHFAVYGETGIGFSHHKGKSSVTAVSSSSTSWGAVAGVGIVIYP